jgi:hypothetical protein
MYLLFIYLFMIQWKPEGRGNEAIPGEPGKMEFTQP